MTVTSKKLIEIALPLEAINTAAGHEKQPGLGVHARSLHLWWARRPLAAARAVIFAQMVDDPSGYLDEMRGDDKLRRRAERELAKRVAARNAIVRDCEQAKRAGLTVIEPGPEPTLGDILAEIERDRLFNIIEELVLWENTTNEKVLDKARAEIWQSWRRTCARNADHPRAAELFDRSKLPAFHDPFAGGGALPLEAQRLGLESYASDLNPVAVLINKAMIEIPPKFAGRPPVHPPEEGQAEMPRDWKGAQGLAEDVRYYGKWMRDEAEKLIGHLYPKVEITADMIKERPDLRPYLGKNLTVIAWIWARTVKSPNPAFSHSDVPLVSTFMLSTKAGKEAYVLPLIKGDSFQFTVKVGKPKDAEAAKNGTKLARGANFACLFSGSAMTGDYIKSEGRAGRMGVRLMAVVAEGERGRVYLPPVPYHEQLAQTTDSNWKSDTSLPIDPRNFWTVQYGLTTYDDLYTKRQHLALSTLSDLLAKVRVIAEHHAINAGMPVTDTGLDSGGIGGRAYAEALSVYLAFAVDRLADYNCSIATWKPSGEQVMQTYKRQSIPMTWDFPESNLFGQSAICWDNAVKYTADSLNWIGRLSEPALGCSLQQDSTAQNISQDKVISTDPPYFDNIGYADLSDFFYVWLRRSLKPVFPQLLATLAVPKAEELVATPYRHGNKEKAEAFFLDGMTRAMQILSTTSHPGYPITIYYAFKQSESETDGGVTSTGWETFLGAIIKAGLGIEGTWPMRTELENRMIGRNTNALASSIVIVCRPRSSHARVVTRREFVARLKQELPESLRLLQSGNIAPVDLAQSAIGPGMSVYSNYAEVLDAEGKALTVHEALALINQILDETLSEQEGDLDAETRWAVAWFNDYGFDEGPFGDAHTYFVRYVTAENALREAGIVYSGRGKVRLLKPTELPAEWTPLSDKRLTIWEVVHHLVRALETSGETQAASLARELGGKSEIARELCYRLYSICERRKRAAEALSYNALVQSWPEIMRLAQESHADEPEQGRLL